MTAVSISISGNGQLFVQLPTGNDSVNTIQLLLSVCQTMPIIARGVADRLV